ncbi:MAG: DNA-binding protein [Actinobacteria bacterium HGW-Actinobacteria-5]|jgi:excisionase family DNA binding protein|nr:MAG: DNA-binding protein [Actinobacteria bacterium HGW-Actinobacteria-5]
MTDYQIFYTTTEAAKLLRCDRRTVHRGIAEGTIPAVTIGRLVRIPAAAFHAALHLPPVGDTGADLRAVS